MILKSFQKFRAGISKCCLSFEHGYNIGIATYRAPGTLELQWCEMSSFEIIARFKNKIFQSVAINFS
jgi:hypothetical protein